jgi:hypothetical protein
MGFHKKMIYNKSKYTVLESQELILVFTHTIFGDLKLHEGYNKDYYNYIEEKEYFEVKEK